MHHWEVGAVINIGWPDYDRPAQGFTIVNMDLFGQVFRARVTDGNKEGGFLVVFDCPEVVLEMLAEQATNKLGFKVIVSSLRCSVDGAVLRSFDYEWYPTPEYAERPTALAHAIADSLNDMRDSSKS